MNKLPGEPHGKIHRVFIAADQYESAGCRVGEFATCRKSTEKKKLQIPKEMVVELSLAERTNRELLRQQAWNYFQMHAAQRLTTFNFYVVSATAIAAGIGLSYQAGFEFQELSLILSGLLVAVSFFFWKLEGRNVELITYAEDALRQFEKDVEEKTKAFPKDGDTPHVALLFLHEDHKTNARQDDGKKYKVRFWRRHYKYDHCLRGVIGVFGLAGLLAFAVSLIRLLTGDPS